MSRTLLSLAGFQVIISGRFWVIAEVFTERTMHGSPANISSRRRLAINGRITRADTIVYPGRLRENFIDGSNLDIRKHRCVLLSGQDHQKNNVYG